MGVGFRKSVGAVFCVLVGLLVRKTVGTIFRSGGGSASAGFSGGGGRGSCLGGGGGAWNSAHAWACVCEMKVIIASNLEFKLVGGCHTSERVKRGARWNRSAR